MKRLIIAAAIAFSGACSSDGGSTTEPPPPPPPPQLYAVSGAIQDSLAGRAYGGATVTIAGRSAPTDFNGNYHIDGVPAGDHTLQVSSTRFRPYSTNVTINSNRTVNARIVRRGIWVEAFAVDPNRGTFGYTEIRLLHLDGREKLPAGQVIASFVSGGVSGSTTSVAGSTSRGDIDSHRRWYGFERGRGAVSINLTLRDTDGFEARYSCTMSGVCTDRE